MENGSKTKHTDLALISMSMAQSMRDTGQMIFKMARERKPGRMAPSMRACTVRGSSMDKDSTFGAMVACIMATGTITRSVAMENTSGQMDGSTLAPGRRTRCMDRAN